MQTLHGPMEKSQRLESARASMQQELTEILLQTEQLSNTAFNIAHTLDAPQTLNSTDVMMDASYESLSVRQLITMLRNRLEGLQQSLNEINSHF